MKIKEFAVRLTENWPAKILSFAFAIILVQFYKSSLLEKKYFSVPLVIENSSDFVLASDIQRVVKVSVWGNASDLAPIKEEDLVAVLDIAGIDSEVEYRIPVKTRIKGITLDSDSIEITVQPGEIKVKLEKILAKRIAVKLALRGSPLENYEIYESSVDPSSIEITGPHSEINKIEEAYTAPISVDNRRAGIVGTVDIFNSNPLISIVGNSKVSYSVKIREILQMKSFTDIQIYFEDLKDEFEVVSEIPAGTMTVRGTKNALAEWELPSNALKILCTNLKEPGIYNLPVQAIVPGRLELIDANPKNIQIEVKKRR